MTYHPPPLAPTLCNHLYVLPLSCTKPFFDDCVWNITSKLRNAAVRQSQPFQNSPIAHRLFNPPERKQLVSLSLLDLLWYHFFVTCHVCHVIEQGNYTWYFLLAENVFTFERNFRGDTTSVSYFCFITRHLLFKTLDTPMFC